MKFTSIELSDKKYLNYIFFEAKVGGKPVTAMFDTRGNSLIKQSIADQIDVSYIDETPIDEKRGWRRARVNLTIGGLEIGSAPVVIAKDESFELMKDPTGSDFPADMILGWNIISQLSFRGDLRVGTFEVQVDDFKEPTAKDKPNAPILYIEFRGERILAAIDSSAPITSVSQKVFEKIIEEKGSGKKNLEMLGLGDENLTYETALTFKIDEDEITLPSAQLNPSLDEKDIDILFGADLLQNTTWAMYSPQRYIRAKQ